MSATTAPAAARSRPTRRRTLAPVFAFCRAQPLGAAGALVILVMGIAAIFAERIGTAINWPVRAP